jgi:hypothetical protein
MTTTGYIPSYSALCSFTNGTGRSAWRRVSSTALALRRCVSLVRDQDQARHEDQSGGNELLAKDVFSARLCMR